MKCLQHRLSECLVEFEFPIQDRVLIFSLLPSPCFDAVPGTLASRCRLLGCSPGEQLQRETNKIYEALIATQI